MITFEVNGEPITQGSMRPGTCPQTGRLIVKHEHGAELKQWRSCVALAAKRAMGNSHAIARRAPVAVEVEFRLSRPLSGRGGKVLGLEHPTQDRDLDKLCRAVCDALTGVLYADDGQVIDLRARKRYVRAAELPGATITVLTLETRQRELLQTAAGGPVVGGRSPSMTDSPVV